jgi:hypothetical protein
LLEVDVTVGVNSELLIEGAAATILFCNRDSIAECRVVIQQCLTPSTDIHRHNLVICNTPAIVPMFQYMNSYIACSESDTESSCGITYSIECMTVVVDEADTSQRRLEVSLLEWDDVLLT